MRLICYTNYRDQPKIVPAPLERAWMDQTPDGQAYRCLPLNIANSHGWLVLNTAPFAATWDGGNLLNSVKVRPLTDNTHMIADSHFGSGVLTFQMDGLFRTDPGYDLMVTGPVNMPKDAIQALSGVVETDWGPFTFTMNWKFTRPGITVTFDRDEPICMIYPLRRGVIEEVEPEFRAFDSHAEVQDSFTGWSNSRRAFVKELGVPGSEASIRKWQKDYFTGNTPYAISPRDHRTKLRPKPFVWEQKWLESSPLNRMIHEQTGENHTGRQRMTEGVLTPGPNTVWIDGAIPASLGGLDFVCESDFLTADECALLAAATRALTQPAPAEAVDDSFLADQVALFRHIERDRPEAAALIRQIQRQILIRLACVYELKVPVFTDAIHLMCWSEGMSMDPHIVRAHKEGSPAITAFRDFASVIYLNDGYEGGDVYFTQLDLAVKPRAGMLLAFTSEWHHEHGVTEVVTGEQLTLQGFHTFMRSGRDLALDSRDDPPVAAADPD
jgi:hypothetical protein